MAGDQAPLPMYVLESFTIGQNQPFTGNPAAVCVLDWDDSISEDIKQKIAFQMNLSETAYISEGWTSTKPLNSYTINRWTLRWFTPAAEVELCGHATLAAANVIFNQLMKKKGLSKTDGETTIVFETKYKGELEATIDWGTRLIELNFPSNPTTELRLVPNTGSEKWIHELVKNIIGPQIPTSMIDDIQLATGIGYLLFRLKNTGNPEKNAELLAQIQPDFNALLKLKTEPFQARDVIVTCQGWNPSPTDLGKPQFFSRFFAPWFGVNEDPVTGSAHTVLAPYWFDEFAKQGLPMAAAGSASILGLQLSQRKGEVLCSMSGTDRVNMKGQSRLGLAGEFYTI